MTCQWLDIATDPDVRYDHGDVTANVRLIRALERRVNTMIQQSGVALQQMVQVEKR